MDKAEDKKDILRQRTRQFASVIIRLYCELPKIERHLRLSASKSSGPAYKQLQIIVKHQEHEAMPSLFQKLIYVHRKLMEPCSDLNSSSTIAQ